MPKIRRDFPHSVFAVWLENETKLNFKNFTKLYENNDLSHDCNLKFDSSNVLDKMADVQTQKSSINANINENLQLSSNIQWSNSIDNDCVFDQNVELDIQSNTNKNETSINAGEKEKQTLNPNISQNELANYHELEKFGHNIIVELDIESNTIEKSEITSINTEKNEKGTLNLQFSSQSASNHELEKADQNKKVELDIEPNTVEKTKIINVEKNEKQILNLKTSSQNQVTNYRELEKSDIENPGWDELKVLQSNKERYRQVKKCWDTKAVPDPNKNLTYHSFRKKHLQGGPLKLAKQHKRHASEPSICNVPLKRKRLLSCSTVVTNFKKKVRDEILQFNNFYKNLCDEDPTVISETQLTEMEEIENLYTQFKKYYK